MKQKHAYTGMSPGLIHQDHLNIISEKLKQGFVTERIIHQRANG